MADLSCQLERAQNQDHSDEAIKPLSVGEKFLLHCEGSVPTLDPATLELRLDEADRYKLKLFDFKSTSPGSADLLVTSYVVGPHELKNVQLTDANHSLVLGDLRFEVASVQKADEPRKEPFPPAGPMSFFPWAFALTILGLFLAVLAAFFLLFLRRRHRRKLLEEIDSRAFQYAPVPEFYREIRLLQREHLFLTDAKAVAPPEVNLAEILVQMDRVFRLFLVRTYRIPAHRYVSSRFLKELSKSHGATPEKIEQIREALVELDRARESQAPKLRASDLEQLLRLMKSAVDEKPTGGTP